MTAGFDVTAGERGILRVLSLRMDVADIRRLTGDARADHDRAAWLAGLLGVGSVDPSRVEVFDPAVLRPMTLSGYLAEAQGIPPDALAADRARLDGLRGPVLILLPGAFGGRAVSVTPDPRLTFIGAWSETGETIRFDALPAAGAAGFVLPPAARAPMSDARIGGMVAMAALLVMFGLTAAFVWLGG